MAPIDYSRFDNIDTSSDTEDDAEDDIEELLAEVEDGFSPEDVLDMASIIDSAERGRHSPAARCSTHRREMDDLNASLCALPVDLRAIVLSNIEHVKTRQILARSSTFREAFSRPGALPRTFDYEGVAGDDIADHLVHVLDRVRSLGKERALQLIGVHGDRLCQYACGRNFVVLKWARNELDLPWAPYPAGPVSDDVIALCVLRETWPELQERWPEAERPEDWEGVTMEDGRVVGLSLLGSAIGGLSAAPPIVIAAIGGLGGYGALGGAVPAVIGQLTSLTYLNLGRNQLTSLPAEIGQLTSLEVLDLSENRLSSLPAEIGLLTSLDQLGLRCNRLTTVPAEIGHLTSLRDLHLDANRLTTLPPEIGQLTSLEKLPLRGNQLTSLPAEIGQLTSLTELWLRINQLTSLPAAIRELEAAGCDVNMDDGVAIDE